MCFAPLLLPHVVATHMKIAIAMFRQALKCPNKIQINFQLKRIKMKFCLEMKINFSAKFQQHFHQSEVLVLQASL